jgi:hypothetical protein
MACLTKPLSQLTLDIFLNWITLISNEFTYTNISRVQFKSVFIPQIALAVGACLITVSISHFPVTSLRISLVLGVDIAVVI